MDHINVTVWLDYLIVEHGHRRRTFKKFLRERKFSPADELMLSVEENCLEALQAAKRAFLNERDLKPGSTD